MAPNTTQHLLIKPFLLSFSPSLLCWSESISFLDMQHQGEVDLYAVLGVASNASLVDLQTAYKSLARKHHPDKARNVRDPQTFVSIQKAWEILRDPIARSCYDGLPFISPSLSSCASVALIAPPVFFGQLL